MTLISIAVKLTSWLAIADQKQRTPRSSLRGRSAAVDETHQTPDENETHRGPGDLPLNPHSFSLEGLTLPESDEFDGWIADVWYSRSVSRSREFVSREHAASQLCGAAAALDISSLKYLLYDIGIPADLTARTSRTALACISQYNLVNLMGYAITLLKGGRDLWLTHYVKPAIAPHPTSVLLRDFIDSIQWVAIKVAEWLVRAGTPIIRTIKVSTPIHVCIYVRSYVFMYVCTNNEQYLTSHRSCLIAIAMLFVSV
jgi:hypothetical protein